MRILRNALLIFFCISALIYGFFTVRERMHRDIIAPVITAENDYMTLSVEATEEEMLQGMTAFDDKDGDVTSSLVVVSQLDFIRKGTRKVNYAAFDSHNNVGTYTRTLTYTDYHSPRFTCTHPFRYNSNDGETLLQDVQVEDLLDPNLSSEIRVTRVSDTQNSVILQVTNSAGDTSFITINYAMEDRLDAMVPSVALSQYIVYTHINEPIDPGSYVTGTYANGIVTPFGENSSYGWENLYWDSSSVDYGTPGQYTVKFYLWNSDGEPQKETELYVMVEEE